MEKEPNIYENQGGKISESKQYKSDEVIIVNKGRNKGGVEFKRVEKQEKENPKKIEEEKKKLEGAYREDNKDEWEIVNGKFRKVA